MAWQSKLLRWYRKNRRDLPWRRTKDPYRIWVSEVMLQQTTVETVIPYYERFLKRFPNIGALARANEQEVLRLWSGLGYYSRARNLHKAAKDLTPRKGERSDLDLPRTAAELQKLPGIGRTTAGAIASIAFGKRVPVLDGNVIRVLSRLFAIRADPRTTKGREFFWRKAEEILPENDLGDYNQSLMELGATVCWPAGPDCGSCPVASDCLARREGRPESYPRGKKKANYHAVLLSAALVQRDGKFLMVRRSDHGLLKGLWEFPMVEGGVPLLRRRLGIEPVCSLPPVRHSVLNRRLTITPYLCHLNGTNRRPPGRWFFRHEIGRLPTSSMNLKILKRL